MVFQVTVTNRQRGAALDLAWLRQATKRIAQAIFENLLLSPPAHLSARKLKKMRDRATLSVTLVSNRQIRRLNSQWRQKDAPTDVLSFPLELDAPPAGLPWEIGEVVISIEKAAEQAQDLGHSLERELAFLFVHGFLHVLGFDHERPEEEAEMLRRQREVLGSAGLAR